MTTTQRPAPAHPEVDALATVEAGLLAAEHHLVEVVGRFVELSTTRAQLRHGRRMSVRDLPAENALSVLLARQFGADGAHLAGVLLRLAHHAEPPTVVRHAPTAPPSPLE
jgi:hypothetical protein